VNTRESVFQALFTVLAASAGFVTTSRVWRHIDEVSPLEMPALFQVETPETAVTAYRKPTIWKWGVDVVLYAHAQAAEQQGYTDAMPLLNNLLDAVIAAISPSPASQAQTLGSLVEDVRVNGTIEKFEGRIDSGRRAAAIIPLEIIPNV
jgi:hypothetical protein